MDIVYVGANGNDHLFHFLADGNRPVLDIYVKETVAQKELPIRINAADGFLDDIQETKGFTHADAVHEVKNGQDGISTRICIGCIAGYIVPRIATMMARVYIPKPVPVDVDIES